MSQWHILFLFINKKKKFHFYIDNILNCHTFDFIFVLIYLLFIIFFLFWFFFLEEKNFFSKSSYPCYSFYLFIYFTLRRTIVYNFTHVSVEFVFNIIDWKFILINDGLIPKCYAILSSVLFLCSSLLFNSYSVMLCYVDHFLFSLIQNQYAFCMQICSSFSSSSLSHSHSDSLLFHSVYMSIYHTHLDDDLLLLIIQLLFMLMLMLMLLLISFHHTWDEMNECWMLNFIHPNIKRI